MLGSFDRPADGSDRTLTPVPKDSVVGGATCRDLAGVNSSTDLGRSAHWSAQVADLGWSSKGFVSTRLLGGSRSTPCVNPESGQWIYWSETVKWPCTSWTFRRGRLRLV